MVNRENVLFELGSERLKTKMTFLESWSISMTRVDKPNFLKR